MVTKWTLHHAEVLDAMARMESSSLDAILSDVPYGLGSKQPTLDELREYINGAELKTGDFMGADWSVPSVRVWTEMYRAMKPGAHAVVFGGARTGDLIALGMRAAGFELRDSISWNYFSSMPKAVDVAKALDKDAGLWRVRAIGVASANVAMSGPNYERTDKGEPITDEAKTWNGYASNLKPCQEPILIARKPLDGRLIDNVRKWGCGALNIDGTRIPYASDDDMAAAAAAAAAQRLCQDQNANRSVYGRFENGPESLAPYLAKQPLGRWPANAIFDEAAAAALDAMAGDRPGMSGGGVHRADYGGGMFGAIGSAGTARNDNGGPSRFHYVVKPTREERELGCDDLPLRRPSEAVKREEGTIGINNGRAGAGRNSGVRNHGPCLKPVMLTRYLATLVLPPARDGHERRIGIPYAGTGSEVIGAVLAGWDVIDAVERDAQFLPACRARVDLALTNPLAFEPYATRRAEPVSDKQMGLFGGKTG